ncbi:MAG: ATP-binding protein [bacterium]
MNKEYIEEAQRVIRDLIHNPLSRRENSFVEFKENYTSGRYERFAKSLAAFSNNKGGIIIFGIKDSPRTPVGVESANFNEEKFREVSNNHFHPEMNWYFEEIKIYRKVFGILFTDELIAKPVVCTRNFSNELVDGAIYFRYRGNNLPARSADLVKLVENRIHAELVSLADKIELVAKIGTDNTALIDLAKGKVTTDGGILYMENELLKKINFIKKGKFTEGGKATLRLIGDVKPVDVRLSDKKGATQISINEDNFREFTPLDTEDVMEELSNRFSNFSRSGNLWPIWKRVKSEQDGSTAYHRRLNPDNPKEIGKWWFSDEFIEVLVKELINSKTFLEVT